MKVLATLDTALDKILTRAHEFYKNKEELDEFLKDRPKAKAQLLDALIAKKSDFLADLMTDANMYAEMISKGFIDAYQLAAKGLLGKSEWRANIYKSKLFGKMLEGATSFSTKFQHEISVFYS